MGSGPGQPLGQGHGGVAGYPGGAAGRGHGRGAGNLGRAAGRGGGVTGNGRGRFSQRGRLNSPISRLGRYLHSLDHYNLHPIPDPSTFQSHE